VGRSRASGHSYIALHQGGVLVGRSRALAGAHSYEALRRVRVADGDPLEVYECARVRHLSPEGVGAVGASEKRERARGRERKREREREREERDAKEKEERVRK
jgi:hypothetical protein